ncbi:MAG TPA: dienelactone hydrolase family protein [Myxococcota bacterium]|jgi:carboxymethylenebutenolidase|nr:dienelactone hydrolase family protein [Myxococcota bacterium]
MEIVTERVRIPAAGGRTMGGYLARPREGAPRPAVLVFMEIFGVNAHIRDVTERVSREGYVALAPDYFHRTGPGVEYGYDEAGMAAGMKLLGALKADEMIADSNAAIGYLRTRPDVRGDRIGCMGFCIGGHMTYLTACECDVRAAASFYGGGIAGPQGPGGAPSTVGRTAKIRGKILCLFGEKDALIPAAQVDAIRSALKQAGVRSDVVVYPGADHGFFCDQRATYQAAAAGDAWSRVKTFFSEELAR